MIKNYFKIAWRNLLKNQKDSTISILGLGLGLACCILLVFYVRFEWSFNNFHKNGNSLYRLGQEITNSNDGITKKYFTQSYIAAAQLDSLYPEIAAVTNVTLQDVNVKSGQKFYPDKVLMVSPNFLQEFTFPLLYGDAKTALADQNRIVITEKTAEQYFGRADVLGELITIRMKDTLFNYSIAGVAKDVPQNSSFKFGILLPVENYFRPFAAKEKDIYKNTWSVGFCETWLRLNDQNSAKNLESKFPNFLSEKLGDFAIHQKMKLSLQQLSEINFEKDARSYITSGTNQTYTIVLIGIAIVILLIAGINFMCLTLSRSSERLKEIAVRKSIGALKKQVGLQIFGEIFLTCSLAMVFGLLITQLSSPYFETLIGKKVHFEIWTDPYLWLALIGLLLTLSLVTGAYPAIYISRKSPLSIFASQTSSSKFSAFIKGLIVVQFSISITFLITSFVMQKQIHYILNKDLGFNATNVIAVEMNPELANGKEIATLFMQEAKKIASVENVSASSSRYRDYSNFTTYKSIGMGSRHSGSSIPALDNEITFETVDENYIPTMGMKILQGENFSQKKPQEFENGIIINKKFADVMDWDNPIGQIIKDKPDDGWKAHFDGKKVIGMVDNFNFNSLFDPLEPIALEYLEDNKTATGTILMKISSNNLGETIPEINKLWNKISPEEPFNFHFIDDLIQKQYQDEIRWKKIVNTATSITIILACFGLFALVSLATQKRTKEIGVRKVFGASTLNILKLISIDFIKLVGIGFLISVPISWYLTNKWLQDFAYQIPFSVWNFLAAGLLAISIALISISSQAIKASTVNPIKSLRTE